MARKLCFVQEQYLAALFGQDSGRYASRWPGTDNDNFVHGRIIVEPCEIVNWVRFKWVGSC